MTALAAKGSHTPRRTVHGWLLIGVTALALAGCGAAASDTHNGAPPTTSAGTASPTPSEGGAVAVIAAPAQAYVDAVQRRNLDALTSAFASDAVIIDVSRRIEGREAIRTWASNEVIGGSLRVLAVAPMPGGQDLLVHWAPPGSAGWQAHYRFTMNGTLITQADLQYA